MNVGQLHNPHPNCMKQKKVIMYVVGHPYRLHNLWTTRRIDSRIIAIYDKVFIEVHRAVVKLEAFYSKYPREEKLSDLMVYFIIQWMFDGLTWNL